MCRGNLPDGHLWNSAIGVPSKVIECDWCVCCGMPRPGYMDPSRKWREGAMEESTERTLSRFPRYFISNDGKVRGPSGRWLKPRTDRDGYQVLSLYVRGHGAVTRRVHWLVLTAFEGDCPAGFEARHLDGNPGNNHIRNLAWSTHAENCSDKVRHGTRTSGEGHSVSKLNQRQVSEIRNLLAAGKSQREIGRKFHVQHGTIGRIARGLTWVD